jgi:hypothetical protein
MATNPLSPLNDFNRTVLLEVVDGVTGVITPVTTGTVTGFLATSNLPTAGSADASLSVSGVYIGGANGYEAGTWLFAIDAAVLTPALLDTHFASATPYFIVGRVSGVRRYEKLAYKPALAATLA